MTPAATRISFSYVIPVHNELGDVEAAILAAEETVRDHAPGEIVVVDDDSTDGTREWLRSAAERGRIALVEQPSKKGAACARNAGMQVASGDVVVFMDADNVPPHDFLERLHAHYEAGADFVTVESVVVNQETIVGRYQQASHALAYAGLRNVTYSQSFSCRRTLAMAVGFREELVGSEDGEFFSRLPLGESVWVKDPEIVVGHRIPDTVATFCRQYRWRGKNTVIRRAVTRGTALLPLTMRQVAVSAFWLSASVLVVPPVVAGARRARRSRRGWRDIPGFVALWILQTAVRRIGEVHALRLLWTRSVVA